MSAVKNRLKSTHTFLKSSPVYSSFPLSVLSLGLEQLAGLTLSCPCNGWNTWLITLIFSAPALFLWALMFVLLAPFRYCSKDVCVCCKCCSKIRNDRQICFKAFAHSLFPSIMWVIFLFLDGNYLACFRTTWVGDYVFDQKLNRKWCAPSELANASNENDLHQKYQEFVSISQVVGYAMLAIFGGLIIIGFWGCYIEKPRTKETDVQTEQVEDVMETAGQVEDVMETAGQVETCVQIERHTQDPRGRRGDMQIGTHSSTQDPQGKVEDDIEDECKRLVGEEGSSQL